ncbi:hypothetical protein [Parvicella tangerina]|uniref:Lipoprotein n=1 Tax=Parvicella tangerina TaxID=2829795 RepID=A0A916NDB9_9FLAO|nr:hypothetical protein [Parvicella tangerina]CAG5085109.1 hypothetical protein CRYO30217_02652 [Parvicella tangerina]
MKIKSILSLALVAGLLLQSCGGEEENPAENNGNQAAQNTNPVIVEEGPSEEDDTYTFVPPSPLQIASIFKKAGLEFDASLVNDVANVDGYTEKFKQSLNFGVYSSDLAYCVKSEKYDQASTYLKTLKELSGKIGLETVFADEDLLDRFNNNIGNQDSIVDILIYVQENTDDYIAQNGKTDLSVIYYAGAWVEGMYFGANAAKANPDDLDLGMLISEQMTIGRSIEKGLLAMSEGDMDAEDLAAGIADIIATFDNFESVKDLGEDAAYLDIYLTPEEIGTISDKIIALRTSIVE